MTILLEVRRKNDQAKHSNKSVVEERSGCNRDGRTGETLYYIPSKRGLFVTDGAGVIGLTVTEAKEMIERDDMTQLAPVPTWDEMTEKYIRVRHERRAALRGDTE